MSAVKRKWDDPEESKPDLSDAAAQAAAIAARIASTMTGGIAKSPVVKEEKEKKDVYDGAFTHDIDINDLRNRYLITKGSTQQQLATETGASITTKGTWYPDRSKSTTGDPPLFLHIAAPSQSVLDIAITKVNELINQDLGPLVEDRSQWAKNRERFGAGGQEGRDGPGGAGGEGRPGNGPGGRPKWPEEKLPIGLESMRNFNVRAKVVGPAGLFVKYIQQETSTRVQIKGLGSGFYENDTGRESDDPMHINITGPDPAMITAAKSLAEDLLEVVREEYEKARAHAFGGQQGGFGGGGGGGYGHQQGGGGGGYGPGGGGQMGGYGGQMQGGQGGYGGYYAQQQGYAQTPASAQSATPNAATALDPSQPPLPSGQPPSANTPSTATDPGAAAQDPAAAYETYRAYWAAYGYDVNDPAFQAWQATQTGQAGGAATPAAPAA